MLTKDSAICISAVDYSETSQILTFFTKAAGKISVIAKGSKRPKSPFDGAVEIFSFGKIVFSAPNREKLATLTEFEQQPGLGPLAGNLFALNCACFAAELINKLMEEYDPHPELFDEFLRFLKNTAEAADKPDILLLLILFQLTLLRELGLQPVLNACVNCKTKYDPQNTRCEIRDTRYEFYFSHSANGLICTDCEAAFPDKIRLTKAAADCLNNLKLLAEADEKTLNEIEKLLISHLADTLGRLPKTAKYILKP